MRLKKIHIETVEESDLLIYDDAGLEYINLCIQKGVNYNVLRVRQGTSIILSLHYFVTLICNLIKFRSFSTAVAGSFIACCRPKIVLTFIDNTAIFNNLSKQYPSTLFVGVQNGVKWGLTQSKSPSIYFDYFFSLGNVEKEIFENSKHNIRNIIPTGSLRAGIFSSTVATTHRKLYDICFISEYVATNEISNAQDDRTRKLFCSINQINKILYGLTEEYVIKNNLSMCIAARHLKNTCGFDEEKHLFDPHNPNVHLQERKDFSSYQVVYQSDLSICLFSTLGYEAMQLNKKVIFGAGLHPINELLTEKIDGSNLSIKYLPSYMKLSALDTITLSSQLDYMRLLDYDKYLENLQGIKSKYIHQKLDLLPHEIIKRFISNHLNFNLH